MRKSGKLFGLVLVGMLLASALSIVNLGIVNVKGEVFGTDVQVSDADGGYQPAVALSSTGTIYVAFEDDMTGLDFSKSIDGTTFNTQISVDSSYFTTAQAPPVAAYGENNVYVAYYQDYKIYCARSINGGSSFETEVQVSDAVGTDCQGNPNIAVNSTGVIYVVWDGGDNIWIDKSTDGTAFGTDVRVDDGTSTTNSYPSIAIDSNDNILVAWSGASGGHVSFAKSIDGGATFSAPVQVDDADFYGASDPSIGVDNDGNIFVAWVYSAGSYPDIYVSASSDGGESFGDDVKVNHDTGDKDQKLPSLAVHACGKVFVAWEDKRSDSSEVYFANSTDGGVSFGTNVKVSDAAPATSPSLVIGDDTEVYVVWTGSTVCGSIYFDQALDATWPSKVADLAAGNPTTSSLDLTWTAPGDNFALGTATTYDIRYSTTGAIIDANWASATQCTGEPTPSIANSTETFTVIGLNNDTTYYFALKTADEIPNWSPLSNVPSGKTLDDWAPDAVIDLSAGSPTAATVTLTWTAPGDNGNTGTATTYDIRYSESEINDTNWDEATNCTGESAPSIAGTTETFEVTGLSSGTTYYFALKTADEVPLWSDISNSPSATTLTNQAPNAPTLTAPANDTWATTGTPTFTWTFTDPDTGDTQGGFMWQANNNSDFSSPEYTNETTSTISSYTPATAIGDGIWYWRVKTKDDKGEWGDYSEYWIIKIDTLAPTGSIMINAGALKTNNTTVALTLSATDTTSDVYQMCFSNNGTTYTTWENYATPKSWSLTTGDGTKRVYVKYKDNAGNVAGYNDTITLNTTATTIVPTEPTTGAEVTASHTGTGTVAATSASSPGDAPSGKVGIGKFIEVIAPTTLTITWVYIKIPYTAADIPAGADEASLKMYYWTGTEWAVCTNTGVDTVNKFIWANETHLTIFAPMAEKAAEAAPINWTLYGGVGIVAIVIVITIAVVAAKKKKKPEVPT